MDYATWQRKKINDKFDFPLELDMSPYIDEDLSKSTQPDELVYELKAIVIHAGGPYGGHYYAYMKDDLKQGLWNRDMPDVFLDQPVEKTKEDPKKEESKDEEPKLEEEPEETNKKGNKKNNKKNNKKQNQGNKPKKEQPQKKKEVEMDFDLCDFPIPYSEKRLVQNWFEFNDSTVTPIMPGTLQSTFGGHRGSAYMLIYRQRKLQETLKPAEIPGYWKAEIQKVNQAYDDERKNYEELKNQFDLIVQDKDTLFNLDEANNFV